MEDVFVLYSLMPSQSVIIIVHHYYFLPFPLKFVLPDLWRSAGIFLCSGSRASAQKLGFACPWQSYTAMKSVSSVNRSFT